MVPPPPPLAIRSGRANQLLNRRARANQVLVPEAVVDAADVRPTNAKKDLRSVTHSNGQAIAGPGADFIDHLLRRRAALELLAHT